MKRRCKILTICSTLLLVVSPARAQEKPAPLPKTVEALYPNLASGVLTFAKLGELPEGVLMRAGDIQITIEDVNKFIANQPKQFHTQLKKNALFTLEQQVTPKLLLHLARRDLPNPDEKSDAREDKEIMDEYVKRLTEKVTVSDEDLVSFYKENESMFCCAPFDKIKDRLGPYALKQKKDRQVSEHIRTIGQRMDIAVSAPWVKNQALLARDNPLNRARSGGKPTLAVFSAASCCGPDRMLGVVESLRGKYGGKVNIIHIDARKERILAARYNVRSVPTQIFYDRAGREVFRYAGLFSQADFEKKLNDMGGK